MLGVGIGIGSHRFRAGGASYPTVLDDGNTVAWFDSAENITKDGSDFVSVWGDKSGLSHDLLQATGTKQPLWTSDGVLFDGVDNFIQAIFSFVQPAMFYVVMEQVAWGTNDNILSGYGTAPVIYQRPATPSISLYAGTTPQLDNTNLPVGQLGIVRVVVNGASGEIIVNETTPVTGNAGSRNPGGITIGSNPSGLSNSNVKIKHIIVRKVADGATDEAAIYSYLADKYSIT